MIADVVAVLTDSADVKSYMRDMRRRDPELDKGWGNISHPLSFSTDGGHQNFACANTEGLFRLIQAISSPKAEPFKRWLAKVGYERVQEIEDPELATKRTRALYKAKGYGDAHSTTSSARTASLQGLSDLLTRYRNDPRVAMLTFEKPWNRSSSN